jgi:leader peptidase (prepilin peptidase)/N-methyltransferase
MSNQGGAQSAVCYKPAMLFTPSLNDAAWAMPVLAAPFIGSFVGVLILRLPAQEPVVISRSACSACGKVLGPVDLVPLLSFALLRGRCRHCGRAIGWFYPATELSALAVAVWAAIASQTPQQLWISCLLGWALLTLAWIDARCFLLPDVLTLPLLLAGLGMAILTAPDEVFWHALGAATGYLALYGVNVLYRTLRGHDGLGLGDAKLLAAAGAWLGVSALPWVILLAALGGLAFAAAAWVVGRTMRANTALPFGTFLAAAFWLLWLYGSSWNLT